MSEQQPESAGDIKPEITFDDFQKLDMRVGTVTEASEHPNADKLIVLQVDLGFENRQLLAGLRPWMPPESLVGKQIVVVVNLAPRKMRGMESNGMLLAASETDGETLTNVVPLTAASELPPGSKVS